MIRTTRLPAKIAKWVALAVVFCVFVFSTSACSLELFQATRKHHFEPALPSPIVVSEQLCGCVSTDEFPVIICQFTHHHCVQRVLDRPLFVDDGLLVGAQKESSDNRLVLFHGVFHAHPVPGPDDPATSDLRG